MAETVKKKICVKTALDRRQWILVPSIAIMNERHYYGYPVIALAFGWLCFRAKIEFGVRVVRF